MAKYFFISVIQTFIARQPKPTSASYFCHSSAHNKTTNNGNKVSLKGKQILVVQKNVVILQPIELRIFYEQ